MRACVIVRTDLYFANDERLIKYYQTYDRQISTLNQSGSTTVTKRVRVSYFLDKGLFAPACRC